MPSNSFNRSSFPSGNQYSNGEGWAKNTNSSRPNPGNTEALHLPEISMSRGGGAIKGIEEKFQVNAVTGTSSFSIPLPFSAGRGSTPSIGLSYNSGTGNGPFGLGWQLGIPSILRKTEKRLPRYFDEQDSDTFLFSGAEDLVRLLEKQGDEWVKYEKQRVINAIPYTIKRYRPRIESGFTRIEWWKNNLTGETYWKTITAQNIHSYFGVTDNARITDPADPSRVYAWMLSYTHDDKGNISRFVYKKEDFAGVPGSQFEKNKTGNCTQLYLKKILYGNRSAWYLNDPLPAENDFLFRMVFDYGEHSIATPIPQNIYQEVQPWSCRKDPFSFFRAGFELRTYRRCRRVMMFHCFDPADLPVNPYLTQSLELVYDDDLDFSSSGRKEPGFSFLVMARHNGHKWDGPLNAYTTKSLPELELTYQSHEWNTEVKFVNRESHTHAPSGLQDKRYLWTDLFNEGIAGILTEQAGSWYYKFNLGNGEFSRAVHLPSQPSFTGLSDGQVSLQELKGSGSKHLVQLNNSPEGYFKMDEDAAWQPMKYFRQLTKDHANPNTRVIDLTGDGFGDLLKTEENAFRWYESLGEEGFSVSEQVAREIDEEKGPAIVFDDDTQSIFLADMTGDGLTDIVRIRNGEICYWSNCGFGVFGRKVSMDNAPLFDHPDKFNPMFLRLADIDGSGTTDIIYLGKNDFRVWMNRNGNEWTPAPHTILSFPPVSEMADVAVLDFLGSGTAAIVYSTPLSHHPIWYIDLMGGRKPSLLIGYKNNCGKECSIEYKSSAHYFLEDKKEGRPWITRLPFPVHCVAGIKSEDKVRRTIFTSSYRYRHGYYDQEEREFRGFGRVEQLDTEDFSQFKLNDASNVVEEELHQPPVRTVSWFHTGACLRNKKILKQYEEEYFKNDLFTEYEIPGIILPEDLTGDELCEALRACKGSALRTEVYADDQHINNKYPFTATEANLEIRMVQPKGPNRYASFMVMPSESVSYEYERNPADPRIAHTMVLEADDLGLPLQTATIVYKRVTRPAGADAIPDTVWTEQSKVHIASLQTKYTQDIDEDDVYRLRTSFESRTYEIGGLDIAAGSFFTLPFVKSNINAAAEILFEKEFSGVVEKRLTSHFRTYFMKDDLSGPLALGQLSQLGFSYKSYVLAFTKDLVTKFYGSKVTNAMLADARYVHLEGDEHWWIQPGEVIFPVNPKTKFYIPSGARDVFGNESFVEYDAYFLTVKKLTDAIGNSISATTDYRTLSPVMVTDVNANRTAVETDELGMVIKSAVMGKAGAGEGDTLADPTIRVEYNLFNWKNNGLPIFVHTFTREKHADPLTRWQEEYSYTDGGGGVIMTKVQAEPGKAKKWNPVTKTLDEIPANPRWIGNGRTIFNNKGNPIKSFEPYFSTTHEYENDDALVESGFPAINYFDARGRNIRIEYPNGTFTKVEFDAWHARIHDVNDTVKDSQWYIDRGSPDPDTGPEPAAMEQRAAWLAAKHHNTPALVYTDSLGRSFYSVADHGGGKKTSTYSETDGLGRYRKLFDQRGRNVSEAYSNLQGVVIYGKTAEKGEQWVFTDVAGRLVKTWDNNTLEFYTTFDKLHRPVSSFVKEGANETLFSYIFYGDGLPNAEQKNLKGKPHLVFDQGGLVKIVEADFKGNTVTAERRIARGYQQAVSWQPLAGLTALADINAAAGPLLENEIFTTTGNVDALNRPVTVNLPDGTVIRPTYGVSNMLTSLDVQLRGQGGFVNFLAAQDYNAKGQRQFVKYGNDLITSYFYDPKSFRLVNLVTKKDGDPDSNSLQNLSYTFDPAGNIVYAVDDAQQLHFFNNAVVRPESRFEYDAIYQLIKASGRELAGIGNADAQRNHTDLTFMNQLPHINNITAVRNYTEQYEYDDLGNIKSLIHQATGASWTQKYRYEYEDDPLNRTNRLKGSRLPGDPVDGPYTGLYTYDAKGNMTSLPHLASANSLVWNFSDQLKQVNLGGGGTAYYVYGAGGQRVRKVIERPGGRKLEFIYLGVIEIYREYQGTGRRFQRNTLHISDTSGKIAQVDTKLQDLDNIDPSNPLNVDLIRYQYGNHLASASMETDEDGVVISYEEYHPFGTTAYRSSKSGSDLSLKRYRFSGKERDEESGFYYFGARYYAAWLGRWTSTDPAGFVSGLNLYRYCSNNPVMFHDPNGMQEGVREVQGSPVLSDPNREADARAELERLHRIRITRMHYGVLPSGRSGWIADEFTPITEGNGGGGSGGTAPVEGGGSDPASTPGSGGDAPADESSGGGDADTDSESPTPGAPASAAGGWTIRNNPAGNTIEVPQDLPDDKLARLREGVRQGQVGRNAGPGNSTRVRRNSPAQRAALNEFRARVPRPSPAHAAGHRIDMQYDLTGRMGENWRDYIWEQGAPNSTDGSRGWSRLRNQPQGVPAGGVARPDTAGRFYNSPRFRTGMRVGGGILTGVGVGFSAVGLYNDIQEGDVPMGIGDTLGIVGGGLELYALGSAAYSGTAVGSVTVGGVAALPLGIALSGVAIAVTSGVSGYRAYQQGDTAGAVVGAVGVAAGTSLAVGGGIALASAAGIAMAPALVAAAPVLIAVGAVAAIGVGVFHAGRYFNWW